jgi:hypothetical protein
MGKRGSFLSASIPVLLVGALSTPLAGAEPESASKELLLLQAKIRSAKLSHANDRKEKQDSLRDIIAEKRAAARPLESLQERQKKLKDELEKKKKEKEKNQRELTEKKKLSRKLKKAIQTYLEEIVLPHITSGIPWKQQFRQDSVKAALNVIEDEKTGLFPSLAAVGRVQQEEEALGRLVELSTIEVPYAGKKLAVQGFHFGLLAVIYANEEGSVLGFVQAGEKITDGIEAVENSPFAEEGYLSAVDILRRRRTPGIIDLYLPTLPVTEGGE